MTTTSRLASLFLALCLCASLSSTARAEDDDAYLSDEEAATDSSKPSEPAKPRRTRQGKRKYFTDNSPRQDAGVFHVAATIGGNFYTEPEFQVTAGGARTPTGNFFKDFGFAAGVTFDYDYSELDENIPLCLRGMIGYKYILNSVHVGSFDGVVRRMWRFSEKSSFGAGIGGSAAVWYRAITSTSTSEEIVFLPSFVMEAGFDFNPFMVDMRVLINRIGEDSTIWGAELYFGFRL